MGMDFRGLPARNEMWERAGHLKPERNELTKGVCAQREIVWGPLSNPFQVQEVGRRGRTSEGDWAGAARSGRKIRGGGSDQPGWALLKGQVELRTGRWVLVFGNLAKSWFVEWLYKSLSGRAHERMGGEARRQHRATLLRETFWGGWERNKWIVTGGRDAIQSVYQMRGPW